MILPLGSVKTSRGRPPKHRARARFLGEMARQAAEQSDRVKRELGREKNFDIH